MTHMLNNANNEQNKIQNELKADDRFAEERPKFHFASPCGWINDPNGFSVFKNEIHLFAQYHPYSTHWGPMHWAHATSKDFILWNIQDVALAPDTDADNGGCFSGTSFEKDGKHIIAYTGVHEEDGKTVQEQCIAIGDGKKYTKFCENPVITYKNIPFEYQRSDFRDPKIWAEGDKYFLAAVLKKKNNFGALVLFESKDLHEWNYVRLVDESRDGLSGMWECPDIFKFDGKDVIILSPQEMKEDEKLGFHDGNNSVYMTGSLDFKSAEFTREVRSENNYTAAQIDYGIDFYAPQTTLSPDGRRIMIAWMQSWESYITPKNYLWSGMMTIPREINLRNGKLYQNPVKEIENYRNKNFSGIIESSAKKQVISGLCVRQFDAEFVLSVPQNEEGKFILNIAESKDYAATIVYDAKSKKLTFDRSRTIDGGGNTKSRSMRVVPNSDGKIKLRILCDTCSAEIFVNDGEYAFTNAFFIPIESKTFSVVNTLSGNILYNAYSFVF